MYPTFTFLVTFVLFCFCSVCVLSLGCVFAFHFNSHFLSKFLCVLFSFHSKIYICVLFGESPGFSPRWDSLSLSLLTFCTVYLCTMWGPRGVPLGNHQTTQNQFSGAFQNSIQHFILSLYIPPPLSIYLEFKTQVKCHRTQTHSTHQHTIY